MQSDENISSSATIIASNANLLSDFLIFFPAKSLLRFRSVSKQWCSLISSPSFCRLHYLHRCRSISQPSFLLRVNTNVFFTFHPNLKTLVPFRFLFHRFYRYVKILQSCNGLLLVECRRLFESPRDNYVYNPTTMQWRDLKLTNAFHGLSLVFDPSKSLHYKVICFKKTKHSTNRSLSVYCSENHAWKDMSEEESCLEGGGRFLGGVYWNDSIYFFKSQRRFSVEDKKVHKLSVPGKNCNVVESNGYMHCVLGPLLPNKNRLCVYELSDVDFSWKAVYDVEFAGRRMDLIGMIREEKVEDSILLFQLPCKIMLFKFGTKTFEELVDFSGESYFKENLLEYEFKEAHQFIGTLAPV